LNTFISSGAFLIARTVIHMKTIPEDFFHMADKLIGILCLLMMVMDFNELFFSTGIMPPSSMTQQ